MRRRWRSLSKITWSKHSRRIVAYLFADFCSGRLRAIDADEPGPPSLISETGYAVASFGRDGRGDVYLLTFDGPILRIDP